MHRVLQESKQLQNLVMVHLLDANARVLDGDLQLLLLALYDLCCYGDAALDRELQGVRLQTQHHLRQTLFISFDYGVLITIFER